MNCLPYPSYIYTKMPSALVCVCVCGAREKGCSDNARTAIVGEEEVNWIPFGMTAAVCVHSF